MITFQNEGLVDLAAVTTFGVSAKECKSPIGYFGTGLKYAVAIVLREGGTLTLWRGLDKYQFTVESQLIRGQDFDIVHMNGQPLGFTTDMGKNWKVWQAFREVLCNTLDEGGVATSSRVQPAEGHTTIQVVLQEFEDCLDRRGQIVLDTAPLCTVAGVEIHPGRSHRLYYRGIMVYEMNDMMPYTYNLTHGMELTEDRTLKHIFMAKMHINEAMMACGDPELLREWMRLGGDVDPSDGRPSRAFLDTVAELRADPSVQLADGVLKAFYDHREPGAGHRSVELTDFERQQLDAAIDLLELMGHQIRDAHHVVVVDNLGAGVHGRVDRKQRQLLLSRRCLEIGTKYVASTLLEEYLHLEYHYEDETRDFQNYLLNRLVTLAEEHYLEEPL